jgi:ABC-2 type transport system permease protein
MFKLTEIIKKNFRLLIRSKSSALIVLIGPLLLVLLISMAFNTSSLYDIKIGTYSGQYSELSNSIIDQLNQDEFNIIKSNSKEDCINLIKTNDIHVCAVFPENLDINTKENVEFYVDKSRMNLVYVIINSISTKVSTKSEELSTALTSTLLNSINNADTKINEVSGIVTKLSVDLKEIKESVDGVSSILNNIENETNVTSLNEKADELNLTGDAGDLVSGYRNFVSSILSDTKDSNSSLDGASLKLSEQMTNVNDIKSDLSGISKNFNSIQIKEVSKIVSPISTEIKPVALESTHFNYTFPALLVIVLLFSGLLVSSTTILEEKRSKAFFRNFITPTPNVLFLIGNYLSNLLVVLLQIIVIFLVVYMFSNILISTDIITNVILVILLVASVFILMGMLIGYLFKSGETANLAVISLACIMLFFSNTILPLETLPLAIREVAGYNPFILGVDALKEILLFKSSLSMISLQFYILMAYIAVLTVLILAVRAFSKRRYIEE